MKRLYYLTDDIDRAEHIARELEHNDIQDRHIHVLSQDEVGLMTRHLHGATYLERLDILRRGLQGLITGLIAGLVMLYIMAFAFNYTLAPSGQVALVALTTLLGSWVGGLVGFAHENHRLERFHEQVENGQHLIMIDVPPQEVNRVRAILDILDEAIYMGEERRVAF
ncbi:hypothetical protein [Saccharospirillum salsuginis]|uniref:DUF1269 domain-containing protein n=1 Tax=Saccharospirillum salsuginis TaxID=418750 RepID=A0A918K0K4_9GAMM|nr:hypothetical protein [Saccharospirillum salsuginis]GGX41110.1 hypothetical protein GCM10007392_04930 [Saccharospirillum salsuginis]